MFADSESLIEATIKAIDSLQTKRATDRVRRGPAKGVGVRSIHAFLQTLQLDNRSSLEVRIKYSEVFDALCTSIESMSIFQFEEADATDIFFSLRGPKEEMLEIARKIQPQEKFDKSKYEITGEVPKMESFKELTRQVEDLTRELTTTMAKTEELKKSNEELELELVVLSNPSILKRELTLAQEAASKI